MKKMQLVFCLLVPILFSCSKNKNDSDSKPAAQDAVIGNYIAMNVPPSYISGSVSISKTCNGQYKLTPNSAPIPSFNFQHDPIASLFVNGFAYLIPKQTSNTVLLDSAYLTLYTGGANMMSFTLTSRTSGTTWVYSGARQ